MNKVEQLLRVSLESLVDIMDSRTVVGEPILDTDELKIYPITDVKLSFVSGGTDQKSKDDNIKPFGGGTGGSLKITPKAFLVVRGSNTDIVMVENNNETLAEKAVENIPRFLEILEDSISKKKDKKNS